VPLADLIFPWSTTSYLVLTARSLNGVRVALVPLQVMLSAARRPCLTSLSRKLFLSIVLQSIGTLKFTMMLVLTGTSTASSVGLVEITTGREAAAVPTIPTITTNAATDILLTIYLSIIVIFFVENIAFTSLFTCI
jgi:hypothetical protein